MTKRYYVTRLFKSWEKNNEIIATGLTLKQAQRHCSEKETSSSTCEEPDNLARTAEHGDWFDAYEEEA